MTRILVVRPFPAVWEFEAYQRLGPGFEVMFAVTQQLSAVDELTASTYVKFVEKSGGFRLTVLPISNFFDAIRKTAAFKKLVSFRLVNFDTDIAMPILRLASRYDFDVIDVIENYNYSSLQAALLRRINKQLRVVITNWENLVFPVWRFALRYWINRNVTLFRVPSISAAWKLALEGVNPKCIAYIPASIDTDFFKPGDECELRRRLGLGDEFTVAYVGRLVREKGVDVLIKALYILNLRLGVRAKLLVVGSGPLRQYLAVLACKLGLGEQVVFTGAIPRKKLPSYYRAADVVVLPSVPTRNWVEQFGYVLVEAMSCGRPVVASRVGAIPEVVVDGVTGILIEPNSPYRLAKALYRLASDEGLREAMGKAARRWATARFSHEVVVPKLRRIYGAG